MSWPSYAEYKPSGIEWLGSIPSHWSTTRLKWSTSLVTSGSRGWAQYYADHGDYFVRIGNLTRDALDFDDSDVHHVQIPPGAEGSRTMTRTGDLLFSITAYLGSVAVVDEAHAGAYVSQHIALARLRGVKLNPWFAGYVALSETGQRQLSEQAYGGTKIQLSLQDIRDLVLPLPDAAEQQLIVRFLDRQVAQIDALIGKQEQLIANLREDRRATITHAVTKGLDPDVAMKTSGLPWVGNIPRHWQVVPIKHVVRSVGVGLVVNPSTYVADSGVPFLLGRNVRDGWIELSNVNYMSEENSRRLESSRLKAGDVVVVRAGYPGRAAVISAELDGANCASILILRHPTLARPEFLAAFFNSLLGRAQVKIAQYGAAQEQINVGDVVNFVMPVPPISEQQEIAARISATTAAIDALIDKANEVIDTLREYRSALITDAVSGKIDVRGAA
jgi:type I restriction enzyme S subunit